MSNSTKKPAKKKPKPLTAEQWKDIAAALYARVKFALNHFSKQTGEVMAENADGTEMELQHWRDYFADGLEKWPGIKIDREVMHALGLPKKQREKRLKEIASERASAQPAPSTEEGEA